MNGAESLVRSLLVSGVDTCFTNPGTSEMHFVAALDKVEGMRCVLCLFEGVVTGAADGYARMAEKPAATLLHLGPGLGNGLANLHNAKKARTPVVNIVGDHATYHLKHDAPLTADIEGIARPVSGWVKTSPSSKTVAADGAAAVAAARTPPGQVATLILPADTAWNAADGVASPVVVPAPQKVSAEAVAAAAKALTSGEPTLLMIAGPALRARGLAQASRIAEATGCRVLTHTSNPRIERGVGRYAIERVPYPVDLALKTLAGIRHVLLLGAKAPVAFFAYPEKPSAMTPPDCRIHTVARPEDDILHALDWIADEVGASKHAPRLEPAATPPRPTGKLTVEAIASALGSLMPENAIVADESVSSGRGLFPFTKGSPPHDWLSIVGGSIGLGLPMATGAAYACRDRKVICLEGDGSGMYTLQALWTQAREGLDVTTVIFANRSYAILRHELMNVGAENPGRKALDMLDLSRPDLDWVAMAKGMGVPGRRATTAEEFCDAFARGLETPGPFVVEAVI